MSQKQPQCIHGAFESLEIFMSSSLQSCSAPCGYRCIAWGSSILSVDVFGSINNAWGRLYDFFSISGLPEPTLPPTSPITPINPELVRIVAPPKPWINPYAPKAPSRLRNELLPEDIPEEIHEKLKIRLRTYRGESCRRDKVEDYRQRRANHPLHLCHPN